MQSSFVDKGINEFTPFDCGAVSQKLRQTNFNLHDGHGEWDDYRSVAAVSYPPKIVKSTSVWSCAVKRVITICCALLGLHDLLCCALDHCGVRVAWNDIHPGTMSHAHDHTFHEHDIEEQDFSTTHTATISLACVLWLLKINSVAKKTKQIDFIFFTSV